MNKVWAFKIQLDWWVLDPDQLHDADSVLEGVVGA